MSRRPSARRQMTMIEKPIEDSSSDDGSSTDELAQLKYTGQHDDEIPGYYWQIQKIVKCLRIGNHTATLLSLCALRDFPLHEEVCQRSIKELGALDVLLNILETDHMESMIQSLRILKVISHHKDVQRAILVLNGLQTMTALLSCFSQPLKALLSETIALVAVTRRARKLVRSQGAVSKLVDLLDVNQDTLHKDPRHLTGSERERIQSARGGALALRSLAKSNKVKSEIRQAGGIGLLARLLKSSVHEDLLISVIGIIHTCAEEENFRKAVTRDGLFDDLLRQLQKENVELKIQCAHAICKCAEGDRAAAAAVRLSGGLEKLVAMLQMSETEQLTSLVTAASGALWHCAEDPESAEQLHNMGLLQLLLPLLDSDNEQTLVNTTGAIGACCQLASVRIDIRKSSCIEQLIGLLTENNRILLINTVKALGACSQDSECMESIQNKDGVRLVWSLLKSPCPLVQATAANTIKSCIENAKDMGDMVTSFVGGLELIVSLLEPSAPPSVLTAVCDVIAAVAVHQASRAVMTDHGVVDRLCTLFSLPVDTGNPARWRSSLALAVARICTCDNNRQQIGSAGVVGQLVQYLHTTMAESSGSSSSGGSSGSSEEERDLVFCHTAAALHQLSEDPANCVQIQSHGAVGPLLQLCAAVHNNQLQLNAAYTLRNIRLLAVAVQTLKQHKKHQQTQKQEKEEGEDGEKQQQEQEKEKQTQKEQQERRQKEEESVCVE